MCINDDAKLFVRRDSDNRLNATLADVSNTGKTPAMHMNYNGDHAYNNSGYLSLFEYDPTKKTVIYSNGMYRTVPAAYRAIHELHGSYIHFIFVPNTIQRLNIDESNVHIAPNTGRTPTLLNTDGCRPPAKKTMDGEVLEYASRYINEYLYLGKWAEGMMCITEMSGTSIILSLMSEGRSLNDIKEKCRKNWPCPNSHDNDNNNNDNNNNFPPGPGPKPGAVC